MTYPKELFEGESLAEETFFLKSPSAFRHCRTAALSLALCAKMNFRLA